jgi:hypothetical protein
VGSPRRAAESTLSSLLEAMKSGGCGRCTGCGRTWSRSAVWKRPEKSKGAPLQERCMMATPSSTRARLSSRSDWKVW